MKTTNLLPANVSLDTNPETVNGKPTKKPRVIFGKQISDSERNELKLILEVIDSNLGRTFTFSEFFNLCKSLRTNPKFNLLPYNQLAARVKTNFENRIAKTLGGTVISANYKESIQSKFFNFEVQTGGRIKFLKPINPTLPLSSQVKADGQTFTIPERSLVIKPKKLLVDLTKAQIKELAKFTGAKVETETES